MVSLALIHHKGESGPEYETRLHTEFEDKIDPRLRGVLFDLTLWTWRKFKVQLVLTQLNRTKEENDNLGGYEFSAHLYGRGADVRTHDFTEDQIAQIVEYLNKTWNTKRQEKFLHIKYHSARTGPHLHINIRWLYRINNYAA